jgi:hypothetical protein
MADTLQAGGPVRDLRVSSGGEIQALRGLPGAGRSGLKESMRFYEFYKDGNLAGWWGTINDNEMELNTTMPDPAKIRIAIHENKVESNLGGISFNRSRDDGQHHEDALIQARLTADRKGGAIAFYVRPANGNNDEDVREVLYLDRGVAHFHVPISAPNVGGGGVSSFLRSPNGRFEMEIQDDGNVVVYDEHNGHKPVSAFRLGFGL